MLFDSYLFIFCFLPVTLIGYHLCTRFQKYYAALTWLVLASLFFYGWWNPAYLILLLLSITVNYVLGYTLWRRANTALPNQGLLTFGIMLNLLFIGYFKYTYFFISNLNAFITHPIPFDPIILPLGISFFTFQKIAFLVDASRGQIKNYRFSDYCLFVTFFPQLIAGPIVQHKQIIPQLSNTAQLKVSSENFNIGMTLFFIGLFKKIAIADTLAVFANAAFNAAGTGVNITFGEAWGGAIAYSLQLYFDFSGYSDMAIGLAYLFGITLPLNFYSPYKAKNIIDFWRRWHMTLSTFLRDYLYIPLGGNRQGPYRRHINLMLTMLLGGLWHGANWTFVLWGALHAFYLMINHAWQGLCQQWSTFRIFTLRWFNIPARLLTLLAVVVAWVPFRADNIDTAKQMLNAMFSWGTLSLPKTIITKIPLLQNLADHFGIRAEGMFYNGLADWRMGLIWLVLFSFIALKMPNTTQIMGQYFKPQVSNGMPLTSASARLSWKPTWLWAGIMALIILMTMMLISEESEFLYFQF